MCAARRSSCHNNAGWKTQRWTAKRRGYAHPPDICDLDHCRGDLADICVQLNLEVIVLVVLAQIYCLACATASVICNWRPGCLTCSESALLVLCLSGMAAMWLSIFRCDQVLSCFQATQIVPAHIVQAIACW